MYDVLKRVYQHECTVNINEINVKDRSNILNCLMMLTVSYTSNTISRPNTDQQSEISLHHIESFDQLIAAHSTLA